MMIENVNRISIIGGSGTGKTTLSENLGKVMNLPVYHIDAYHHLENWVVRDKTERDEMILKRVSEEKWIIDGTYKDTLKQRLDCSDLVIFLDYSSFEATKGALIRGIKYNGKEKPEIPGCKEKISLDYLRWVWNWRKNKRNIISDVLNDLDKNKVLVFKNRRELNKWFKKQFDKKIEVLDCEKKLVK